LIYLGRRGFLHGEGENFKEKEMRRKRKKREN
jgi:hypothetical protein